MNPERKQQAVSIALRKLVQGRDEVQPVADQLKRLLPSKRSSADVLEGLVRWLLDARGAVKQAGGQQLVAVSRLMEVLRHVAVQHGIDPERFYARALEVLLLDAEGEEGQRSPAGRSSTRERILDAALDVFSEKGFHQATVDEIAERAGLGKGTLYRYFANKETLFNELVRFRLEELEQQANAVLDGQDDVLTMISKYLRIYFEFFDRNERLYRVVVQQRGDVGREFQDVYVKTVMRRIPVLKRKIYRATQKGVLKEVDFQTVFYGVMGFIHGVIQKWVASDCSYSLVDELPTVMEVLFYGFVKHANKA
ncbi:MAG: TetR/AcrR family transcriptional regulator [Syntrophobacteraceae bacterium]